MAQHWSVICKTCGARLIEPVEHLLPSPTGIERRHLAWNVEIECPECASKHLYSSDDLEPVNVQE